MPLRTVGGYTGDAKVPGRLVGFVARHPGIRIEIEEQNSSGAVMAVLDGRADLGILPAVRSSRACRSLRIGNENRSVALLGSRSH